MVVRWRKKRIGGFCPRLRISQHATRARESRRNDLDGTAKYSPAVLNSHIGHLNRGWGKACGGHHAAIAARRVADETVHAPVGGRAGQFHWLRSKRVERGAHLDRLICTVMGVRTAIAPLPLTASPGRERLAAELLRKRMSAKFRFWFSRKTAPPRLPALQPLISTSTKLVLTPVVEESAERS